MARIGAKDKRVQNRILSQISGIDNLQNRDMILKVDQPI